MMMTTMAMTIMIRHWWQQHFVMWVMIIRLENGTITHDDLDYQKSQGLAKTLLSTSTILLLVGSPLMMFPAPINLISQYIHKHIHIKLYTCVIVWAYIYELNVFGLLETNWTNLTDVPQRTELSNFDVIISNPEPRNIERIYQV